MNYYGTFIAVSDDSKAGHGKIPAPRGSGRTVAQIQYEMLSENPFTYTQEDVQFESWFARQGLEVSDDEKATLRAGFLAKDQPCLRTSPLARSHGWGLLFDADGRIALVAVDSPEYAAHLTSDGHKVIKAVRAKRV